MILHGRSKKLHYIKLIKLLYMLDRAALWKWGNPVTTDDYISMQYGPVGRNIYGLFKAPRGAESTLRKYISPPSHFMVGLLDDPGASKLSDDEERLIESIFKKYGALHWSKLVDKSHRFKEWQKEWSDPVTHEATTIEIRDILKADGRKTSSEIEEIVSELESLAVVERMIR